MLCLIIKLFSFIFPIMKSNMKKKTIFLNIFFLNIFHKKFINLLTLIWYNLLFSFLCFYFVNSYRVFEDLVILPLDVFKLKDFYSINFPNDLSFYDAIFLYTGIICLVPNTLIRHES